MKDANILWDVKCYGFTIYCVISASKALSLSSFYTSQIKNIVYSHKTTAATRILMWAAAFAS
jgi:hypothetical protein